MSTPAQTDQLFETGLAIRKEVLSAEYVEKSLANANDFTMAIQTLATQWAWGAGWSREGLPRRDRSIINLAMLMALGHFPELRLHVRGALRNGVTVEEIKEVLIHATMYCGLPAGMEAFKYANEAIQEAEAGEPAHL